jgi:phage terminase small subunit
MGATRDTMAKSSSDLTPRERSFVDAYLLRPDAQAAAIAAGYASKSAAVTGHEVLHRPRVAAALVVAMERRAERTQVNADTLLTRLAHEVDADMADLFDDQGGLRPVKDWPAIWRKGLIAGVEIEQLFAGEGQERRVVGSVAKIKMSDRVKRLELLGRHVGVNAFKSRVELEASEPLKQLFQQLQGQGIRPTDDGSGKPPPAAAPGIIRPRED